MRKMSIVTVSIIEKAIKEGKDISLMYKGEFITVNL